MARRLKSGGVQSRNGVDPDTGPGRGDLVADSPQRGGQSAGFGAVLATIKGPYAAFDAYSWRCRDPARLRERVTRSDGAAEEASCPEAAKEDAPINLKTNSAMASSTSQHGPIRHCAWRSGAVVCF